VRRGRVRTVWLVVRAPKRQRKYDIVEVMSMHNKCKQPMPFRCLSCVFVTSRHHASTILSTTREKKEMAEFQVPVTTSHPFPSSAVETPA